MKQTIDKAGKKAGASWSDVIMQHSAVRPTLEHDLPRTPDKSTVCYGQDFSQLPITSIDSSGQKSKLTQACPFTPQRCPFGGECNTCPPRVQAKLNIGQTGDKYEQEADRVAEQVVRMPEPKLHQKGCSSPRCKEEDENKNLQAKSIDSVGNVGTQVDHPLIQNVLSSPGQPLDAATRSFMEPRFGQDLSGVRVHTDTAAERSAHDIKAHAYTVGDNIVIGGGQYVPGSREGKLLIAHELTHVLQQSSATGVSEGRNGAERRPTQTVLQRQAEEDLSNSNYFEDSPSVSTCPLIPFEGTTTAELYQKLEPGTVTVVEFTATWCNPCQSLRRFLEYECGKYRNSDIPVRFYSVDIGDDLDSKEIVREFVKDKDEDKGGPPVLLVYVGTKLFRKTAFLGQEKLSLLIEASVTAATTSDGKAYEKSEKSADESSFQSTGLFAIGAGLIGGLGIGGRWCVSWFGGRSTIRFDLESVCLEKGE